MPEQNIPEPEYVSTNDSELGPVVLRCRPLSPIRWAAEELGVLVAYIVAPLFLIPFYAFWPAMGVLYMVLDRAQWVKITAFTCCFVTVYAIMIWFCYFLPRGDYLVLHENGFRLKILFRPWGIPFGELRSITFGLVSVDFGAVTNALALVRPAMLRELSNAALNLHYKNGRKVVFRSFLHRFEAEDLQTFLNYVAEHHPELCGVSPA